MDLALALRRMDDGCLGRAAAAGDGHITPLDLVFLLCTPSRWRPGFIAWFLFRLPRRRRQIATLARRQLSKRRRATLRRVKLRHLCRQPAQGSLLKLPSHDRWAVTSCDQPTPCRAHAPPRLPLREALAA
jgi:hypothetical protein